MKRKYKRIGTMGLAGVLCLSLCVCAWAKMNVSDELWEEPLIGLEGQTNAGAAKETARSPRQPVMIDVLDLKAIDILDVLKLVSQKSGLNIIAGQDVKGKVTVFLKNIEVQEVLRIIVKAYGWAYIEDGNVIRIMTDKEYVAQYGYRFGQRTETRIQQLSFAKASDVTAVLNQMKGLSGKIIADQNSGILILTDEPPILGAMEAAIQKIDVLVKTEVFALSYARVEDMAAKASEMLTPSIGSVKTDARSNKMMISDTSEKIKAIRRMIEAFDQKEREVLIEARILQVTLSDEYKLGIDWEAIVSDYHGLKMAGDFDVLDSTEKRGTLGIGTLAADQYTVLIQALETVGHTEILSAPRIAVVNNKEAKILVGSTEPYVTTTTTTPSSGPTTTAESVNFIDVGVKLYVTPTIHEDDFITMKIRPEVSSVVSNVTTSNNNTIPVVDTSEAETTVRVKDRVTIVIGGLIKDEKIKTTKKIPILGNIPFFGAAFQNKSDLARKTEIALFLTPRIISGDVEEGAMTVSHLPSE